MKRIKLLSAFCLLIALLCFAVSAAAPKITIQPQDAYGTTGGKVSFTCKAEGKNVTYTWCWYNTASGKRTAFSDTAKGSAPDISGTRTDTFTIDNLPAGYVGLDISCYIKDDEGAVWSDTVSILEGLRITKQPTETEAAVGDTVSLHCETNAEDAVYTWCWYYEATSTWPKLKNTDDGNGFSVEGADTNTLTLAGITAPYIGQTYACHIQSELGSMWTTPVTITAKADSDKPGETDEKDEEPDDADDKEPEESDADDKDDHDKQEEVEPDDTGKTEVGDDKEDETETGNDETESDDGVITVSGDVTVKDGVDACFRVTGANDAYNFEWQYAEGDEAYDMKNTTAALTIPYEELTAYADGIFYCILTDRLTGEQTVTEGMKLIFPNKPETDDKKEDDKKEDGKTEDSKEEDGKQDDPSDSEKTTEDTPLPFTDVAEDSWYYENVKLAYECGLINGMTETEFAPTGNLTYAQAIKLAACLHQYYSEGEITLTVSETGLWYESYLQYGIQSGLIDKEQGEERLSRPDIIIDANNPITREAYAVLFADALPASALEQINEVPDGAIPDVKEENNFYGSAIYKFYRAGITIGRDAKGTFDPRANITRAEISAILARLINPEMRQTVTEEFGK